MNDTKQLISNAYKIILTNESFKDGIEIHTVHALLEPHGDKNQGYFG